MAQTRLKGDAEAEAGVVEAGRDQRFGFLVVEEDEKDGRA